MSFSHLAHGLFDDFLECWHINVGEFVHVETAHTLLVLAEFFEKRAVCLEARHDVDGEIRFARGEASEWPIALLRGALGFVVI